MASIGRSYPGSSSRLPVGRGRGHGHGRGRGRGRLRERPGSIVSRGQTQQGKWVWPRETTGSTGVGKPNLKSPEESITIEDLVIYKGQRIGAGAFGSVFKGLPCAGKVLHHTMQLTSQFPTAADIQDDNFKKFERECKLLERYNHPNVATLLVMELMDESLTHFLRWSATLLPLQLQISLTHFLRWSVSESTLLPLQLQISFCHDVACGLQFLHSNNIVHRDLCSDNVLLKHVGSKLIAAISDFGLCRIIPVSRVIRTVSHREAYMPPVNQRTASSTYDTSLDMFSFGVVAVQVVRKVPMVATPKDRDSHVQKIIESHPLREVILCCLREDKEKRPNISEIYHYLGKLLSTTGEKTTEVQFLRHGKAHAPFQSESPADVLRELEKEEPPQEIGMDLVGEVVKERTPEEFTIMLGRATKLKIRPQDEEQRQGKLVAIVSGENTGPANSKVSQDKSGNFEVFFKPTEADCYTLDMKFKDRPLPRGPFILNYVKPPSDPSKCRLLGKENIPAVMVVNEDVYLQVDSREAGYGTLDIKAEAPALDQYVPKLVAIPSKEEPRIADVKYTPTAAGIHTLHFQWAKEEIPESPVSFPVVDPGMVVVTEPDKVVLLSPAHFQVDALYAGPGRLTGTCMGVRCGNVPINVNPQTGARYDVSFIPLVPDTYSLFINWVGKEIPNSPFLVTLLPLTPADQVVVTDPVLPEPGRPTDFLIETVGKGTLTANCIGEECGKVPVQVINTGEGKHKVTFTPQAPDLYTLHMFYDDTQVRGSPFEFDLRKPKVTEAVQVAELAQEESSYIPPEFEDSFDVSAFTLEAEGQKEGVTEVEKKPPEEFTNFVGTALVVKVRPQSEEQRKGQVVATAIGESTGTAEIRVSQRPDDSYEVTFNPSEPDRYTVDIQMNEEPIPRSPFVVKYIMPPSDPSKCKIIGLEDLPAVLEVNKEITLMVDATKAGPEDLEVSADGPSSDLEPSKLVAKLREGEAGRYEVTYIPTSQGTHTLNFLWGGKSIPQSPVRLVVIELARVEVHQYGKPVGLDIDSDCKPSELRAYALHEGSETQLRVKINRLPRGKYLLTFQPKQPGLYYIRIFERNTELSASPIVIRYAKPPKAEACKVIGLSTTTYMGETLTFTVDVTEAGGGELLVRALGPGGKEKGTLNVGERKDDTFLVEYIPSAPGKHQFQISWAGKTIPGSPYPLSVRDHTKEELISWLFLVDQLGASQLADIPEEGQKVEIHTTTDNSLLLRVKAQTPQQKKGVLTATATGKKTGSIKIKSTKTSQDTFEALFSPPAADNYTIEAKLDQEQVPNTPVNVIYSTPPPDPSKCRIIGLESIAPILQVNMPVPFKVDTRFAGSGKLNIAADGPVAEERPKLQAASSKDEPGIVDIVYTPTAAGTHTLNLTWSGESIPGSPLALEVGPIHTHAHGRSVGVDINIDCKSSELESYAIHEESGRRYRVKVSKVEKGKFRLSFQPSQPGLYGVYVLIKKKEIAGCPFYLRYDSPPRAEAVEVRGLSDTGYIREPINFVVDTTDAGNGDLVIKVESPATKEGKPELIITDNKDKTYSVGYTPNAPGNHQFDIAWSGKPVPGSPFGVNVLQPLTEEVAVAEEAAVIIPAVVEEADFIPPDILRELVKEEPPQEIGMDLGGGVVKERTPEEFTIMLGRATKLKIRPQDEEQRRGKLVATVSGENTGPANSKVSQDKSGNFEVFFNPTEADHYTLDMKFKDSPLPRGPFILNYVKPPSDPSKCRLLGKENIPAVVVVNEDVYLQVDSREAGYGTLDIKAEAPALDQYVPKLVANPSKEEPRIADVKYTPTAAGIHTSHFQWAKEEIPESPVSFPVVDPGMVVVTGPDKVELLSPAHFQVDTLYAGPGRLTGTCTGVRCGNVPINVNPQTGARYDVSFIPLVPDMYSLSINWAGREIPKSPFSVTLLPLTPADQVVVTEPVLPEPGHPTDFLIETVGKGTLTANCIGEECGKVPVQVINTGGGKHKVTFTPQAPDLYRLHMFYDDTQVKGSPFEFDLRKPKVTEAVQVAELAQEESCYIPEVEKKPSEEFTNFVGTALVVKIKPQSKEQRKGQVVATAIGESTGTAEIRVSQRPDDSYEVTFNPSEPDRYTVDIRMNDKTIPRSPFVVKYIMPPSDPSKCKIIGLEDLPAVLEVNKEITLMVDATKAGPEDLEVSADGPSSDLEPSKLVAKLREGEAGRYEVTYIPTSQGTHTLNFLWGGKSIPQSPVRLVVIELARVEVHQYGKPVGLDIDSDCKPSELRAYALHEGSETQLRVKINRLPRGKYLLTFQPKQPGLYYIRIFERNTELSASPIVIRYSKPPKPEACKVIGLSTTTYMGETLTFTVDVTEAGGGELLVRALGPGGKEKGTLNVGERKDDTYLVEYIPSAPGKHQFQISWAGKTIPGSPYPLSVRDHTKEELISWLFLVDQLGASQPADIPKEGQKVELHTTTDNSLLLRVKAQTPKQKKGVLTATATGEKTGTIKIKSTKTSQDTFEALFSLPAADNYTIEAKLDQEQVPNTPVNVIYSTPPPNPSKCRIIGLESIPPILQVNMPVPFKVDTRFAGSGKLNIAADGPVAEERHKLQAASSKDEPGIVDVVYTPTAAGTHTLNLTWSGESIPGSPLALEVGPIHTHAHGRSVGVDINIDCKSSELESYAIHEESGSCYRVKVSKVEKGKFRLSFQPSQPGLYGVYVLIKKKEIAGCPFYLRYDSPPRAEAVEVRGLSDTGYIREPINFVVDTTDAGNGEVFIKVESPATKEKKPELTITDNKDKTYSVGYTPNAPGDHQFDIAWSGKPVPGSPFGVNVLQLLTEEVAVAEEVAVIIPAVVEEADFIPPDILQELVKEEPPQEIGGGSHESKIVMFAVGSESCSSGGVAESAMQTDGVRTEGYFRGAEVVDEVNLVITNEAMSFPWDGYGFKLNVPSNALPEGISEYPVNIKASLMGQFELPEGYELVSAVYWVYAPGKFSKPLTMEAQHCANFSNPNQLCFVRTSCTQESLPYKFKVVDGGSFTLSSKYGILSTTHFSGNGIAKEVMPGEHSCQYCAQVYFTAKHLKDFWYCHFVVTKDMEMCLAMMKRKYRQEYDIAPPLIFDGDYVALDIPDDGIETNNGWRIVPLQRTKIKRDRVNSFSSEKSWVPECVLLLQWLHKNRTPDQLEYKVTLLGTGEEDDFFRIFLHPESSVLGASSDSTLGLGIHMHTGESSDATAKSEPSKNPLDTRPTLPELLKFSSKSGITNIPQMIGTSYETFGTLLLNDKQGEKIDAITEKAGAKGTILEILKKWLRGEGEQPATWRTLVQVLKDSELSTLAQEIEAAKV